MDDHWSCLAGSETNTVKGIAYVLLGGGVRLFDHLGATPIHLEHIRTLEAPGATHLSLRVVK